MPNKKLLICTRSFLSQTKLLSSQQAFFLHRPDSFGAELEPDLFTINCHGFGLQIRLPNLVGVALREANIAAVLLALTGDIALLHNVSLLSLRLRCYCSGFPEVSQSTAVILKRMQTGFDVLDLAVIILSVLVAMTIHESMHAYVGYLLGDTTARDQGRISLNPLDHIDPIYTVLLPIITIVVFGTPILAAKPVPFDPTRVRYGEFGAALIALAGPVSNFLLAILGAILLHTINPTTYLASAVYVFVELNVALGVFNLIPIPPLDGSRVLFAFAPEPLQDLMRQIERYGMYIIFALVLFGGWFGGWLTTLNQMVLQLLLGGRL